MPRQAPRLTSDKVAETFLDQDVSDLDFAHFKPVQSERQPKTDRVNMRLPAGLLDAVKARAAREGMPYQRYIRRVLEEAVGRGG
jgi:predicted DNA binding CopG/RHH family protein